MVKQRWIVGAVAVLGLVACGGGKKADTTPVDDTGGGQVESDPDANAANMVSPEQMDEIKGLLDRKQRIVSRCLADAVDAKELPKNSRGKIALEIMISSAGKAETVKVIKSSLESKMLEDCVIAHIKAIQFPTLPKTYETSYAYAFEAM